MAAAEAVGPVEAGLLAELGATFTSRFAEAGGARLRYLEGGQGAPLVLAHGRGGAATTWLPQLPALARHHRVIAVDLPGFGLSSPPPVKPSTPEQALAFFVEPVEALLVQLALGPAAYVGHSLGALVGVELALRGKVPLERLVLIGPMGAGPSMTLLSRLFFRAGPERLARWLGRSGYARLMPGLPSTPMNERLNALDYELLTASARAEAAAAFDALCPLRGPRLHRQARLGEVKVPTFLLWGERDEVFPVADARDAASRLPDATLRTPPLGHTPHLEAPDMVLPLLLEFLRTGSTSNA